MTHTSKSAIIPSFVILLVVSLSAGCFTLKKQYPEKHLFVLDVAQKQNTQAPNPGTVLTVRPFRISPQYEGRGLIYRKKDLNYEIDFYNEFLIPPAALVTEQVSVWLKSAGIFEYVTDTSSRLMATHSLEGLVVALYGDYSKVQSAEAVLQLQLILLDETAARPRPVFERTYRKTAPIPRGSAEELVQGWNNALRQILEDFEKDVRQKISLEKP